MKILETVTKGEEEERVMGEFHPWASSQHHVNCLSDHQERSGDNVCFIILFFLQLENILLLIELEGTVEITGYKATILQRGK